MELHIFPSWNRRGGRASIRYSRAIEGADGVVILASTVLVLFLMTHRKRGIYNTAVKQEQRKQLRKSLTPAEATLWKQLQGRRLMGYKFRRQFSIGPYIVDFYCPEYRLAVELDGAGGQEYLKERGIRVVRFENHIEYLLGLIVANLEAS